MSCQKLRLYFFRVLKTSHKSFSSNNNSPNMPSHKRKRSKMVRKRIPNKYIVRAVKHAVLEERERQLVVISTLQKESERIREQKKNEVLMGKKMLLETTGESPPLDSDSSPDLQEIGERRRELASEKQDSQPDEALQERAKHLNQRVSQLEEKLRKLHSKKQKLFISLKEVIQYEQKEKKKKEMILAKSSPPLPFSTYSMPSNTSTKELGLTSTSTSGPPSRPVYEDPPCPPMNTVSGGGVPSSSSNTTPFLEFEKKRRPLPKEKKMANREKGLPINPQGNGHGAIEIDRSIMYDRDNYSIHSGAPVFRKSASRGPKGSIPDGRIGATESVKGNGVLDMIKAPLPPQSMAFKSHMMQSPTHPSEILLNEDLPQIHSRRYPPPNSQGPGNYTSQGVPSSQGSKRNGEWRKSRMDVGGYPGGYPQPITPPSPTSNHHGQYYNQSSMTSASYSVNGEGLHWTGGFHEQSRSGVPPYHELNRGLGGFQDRNHFSFHDSRPGPQDVARHPSYPEGHRGYTGYPDPPRPPHSYRG